MASAGIAGIMTVTVQKRTSARRGEANARDAGGLGFGAYWAL